MLEVATELEKLAAEKGIEDLTIEKTSVVFYRGETKGSQPDSVEIKGSYKPDKAAGKEEFEKKTQELLSAKGIDADCEIGVKLKGTQFPTLAQLTPIGKDPATPEDVAPRPGEATLFDFWATWCGPCQGPMGHNQEMLATHPEWAGKVRVVGVSIDDGIEAPTNRVKEKGWTKVDHYWGPGGWGSASCKAFGIHGIPFCVLVDGTGKICLTGHPASMNLEVNLPKLAAGGSLEDNNGPDASELKKKDYTFEKCSTALEELVKAHKAEITSLPNVVLAAIFSSNAKAGKYELAKSFVMLRFEWSRKTKVEADRLKELVNTTFGQDIAIKNQDHETVLFSIATGYSCSKCQNVITGCDQYLCAICKPGVYFCTKCVEAHKNPTALTDLVHPHGLYFIQKTSGPKLDELELGDFKMDTGTIENKTHNTCGCDFRGLHPEGHPPYPVGIRWKCVNCRTVDVCDRCFGIARNPDDPQHQALLEAGLKAGHDFKTHVYVRQEFVDFLSMPY